MRRGKGDIKGQKRRARQRKGGISAGFIAWLRSSIRELFFGTPKLCKSSHQVETSHICVRPRYVRTRPRRKRRIRVHGFNPSHHSISQSLSLFRRKIIEFKKSHGGKTPSKQWLVWQVVKISHAVVKLHGYRGHWIRQRLRKTILNQNGIPFKIH